MANFDLHLHTHWSYDAFSAAEDYFRLAREKKTRAIAITDHHLMDGYGDVLACAEKYPEVGYIAGSEITVNCEFGAIEIVDGIAVIDKEKCKACGKCVAACPKHLIEIVPGDTPYMVACSSQDKGKEVKEVCQTGCIGCSLCAKNCPAEAITMQGNVAKIDPDKCVGCRICAEKCPAKVIKELS